MDDQELGFKFFPFSSHQPSLDVFVKPFPLHSRFGISSFDPTTPVAVVSSSQGNRTRPIKELRAISVKDSFPSRLNFSASSMEPQYRPLSMELVKRRITFKPLLPAQQRSYVCLMAKPISRSSVGSSSLFSTAEAMLSNSQGELADKLTRLTKECDQTMDLYSSACNEDQAMSAAEKGELKDKLTKLFKERQQTRFDVELYNSACNELQHATDYFNNFDFQAYRKYYGLKGESVAATTSDMNSDILRLFTELADVGWQREAVFPTYIPEEPKGVWTSKREMLKGEGEDDVTVQHERKYEARTLSKGKQRMEGEGEDVVAAQYMDPRSLPKEELKDVELLIPIPSQPHNPQRAEEGEHNCALPQRAEGREHNYALPQRAEGREHDCALPQRTEAGEHNYAPPQRAEGREHNCVLPQRQRQRPEEGEDDCAPTVSESDPNITRNYYFTLLSFGNPSVSSSPPSGLSDRANPSTTQNSFYGLFNIGQFNMGN